ncbi:MAG TPA: ATP-binding cassette domain-containing protein [Pseudobacteroides sp.]|uniref:ATP-binding cassette domain-containing protein n=1 Tax=Pseudobacteroides sp. TaxID=1968840 RepID=UPI002F940E7A
MRVSTVKLNKSYKKKGKQIEIIKDFSYDFKPGALYQIKGESGKGKTTLLTLLSLLQKQDSGEIFFNDELVSSLNYEKKCKFRREHIGIIFQDYNLLDSLTVIDNICLLDICENKVSAKDAYKKAEEVLSLLNLSHRSHHLPFELSGGEQQRVGIARAIIKNPSILICDEPVSNLDMENSKRIVDFINDYCHKNNKLVLVTSHNEYFDDYADEIINL